jgi:hypothetical protein
MKTASWLRFVSGAFFCAAEEGHEMRLERRRERPGAELRDRCVCDGCRHATRCLSRLRQSASAGPDVALAAAGCWLLAAGRWLPNFWWGIDAKLLLEVAAMSKA